MLLLKTWNIGEISRTLGWTGCFRRTRQRPERPSERLWTPWRRAFIEAAATGGAQGCFLCANAAAHEDRGLDGRRPYLALRARTRRGRDARHRDLGHLAREDEVRLATGGQEDAHEQAHLVAESAAPLRALIGNVARLHGAPHATDREVVTFAATIPGVSPEFVATVLALDEKPHQAKALAPRMNEYLVVAERLWAYVDGWGA